MGTKPTHVNLFVTCLIDHFAPAAAEAVVTVLERQGLHVLVPAGQTCCGQPAFNGGFWDDARRMAAHTVEILERALYPRGLVGPVPIVVPSGSCCDMIVHHYRELFQDEPRWQARVDQVAAHVYEFSQFLVDVLGVTDVGAHYAGRLTYHSSCHLQRGLGIRSQPEALLAHVAGAEVTPLPRADECCGFGGLFSIKFPLISEDMLANKLANIAATQADRVVGCDLSCLLHINGGLHRAGKTPHAVHIAEILAQTDPAGGAHAVSAD